MDGASCHIRRDGDRHTIRRLARQIGEMERPMNLRNKTFTMLSHTLRKAAGFGFSVAVLSIFTVSVQADLVFNGSFESTTNGAGQLGSTPTPRAGRMSRTVKAMTVITSSSFPGLRTTAARRASMAASNSGGPMTVRAMACPQAALTAAIISPPTVLTVLGRSSRPSTA